MRKVLAACTCAVLIAACDTSVVHVPAPSAGRADDPAASLRVQLDLLFVEHSVSLAKLALAAAAGRRDGFHTYAAVLAANGADITNFFRSAIGETAGSQAGAAWSDGNDDAVRYIVSTITHDDSAETAIAKLSGADVNLLSTALLPSLPAGSDNVPKLAYQDTIAFKTMVDDIAAGSYQSSFMDLGTLVRDESGFADVLASDIVSRYSDRFPGDPVSQAANSRSALAVAMATQAGYYSMLTEATVARATAEQAAAQTNAVNARGLPPPAYVWSSETPLLVSYASTGDSAIRQNVLNRAAAPLDLNAAFTAMLEVVDDQRASAYARLGLDDRAAATAFAAAADQISGGSVQAG